MQKRDSVRKDELWTALQKSGKSYEDILGFLKEHLGTEFFVAYICPTCC